MAIELVDALHADGSLEMTDDKLRINVDLQDDIAAPTRVVHDSNQYRRSRLHLIAGANTVLTVVDNDVNDQIDVTIGAVPTADVVAPFTWSAGAASLNVAAARIFAATNTLTANSTLTLTGGVDGSNGVIALKHDGTTTAHTLAFTVAGRTVIRDLNVPNHDPLTTANGLTEYHYLYYTLAGTAYCRVLRAFLQ